VNAGGLRIGWTAIRKRRQDTTIEINQRTDTRASIVDYIAKSQLTRGAQMYSGMFGPAGRQGNINQDSGCKSNY
jgi:hypothetical protein